MTIILYSIPLFFVLIGAELAYSARTGGRLQRLNDSVADLSCGILSQISGVFTKLLSVGIFIWVAEHWAIQRFAPAVPNWPDGAPVVAAGAFPWIEVQLPELLSWAVVFLLVDLAYYWSHRLSHEINLLWAGHVVHHSSEEYNLAVALRQSSLHGLMTWVFYTPLALVGVPWTLYVATYALNLVYQFWIHTRAVGSLGRWTELVLNTPSHHRVHHGRNPKYLDSNYAGVFIIWDRLFGTFQPEEEEPVYGITKPLRSWNPLWANVHVFWEIARDAWRAPSWRERWMYLFGPPGWRPNGGRGSGGGVPAPPEVDRATYEKYDPEVPGGLAWYGFAQFGVALAAAFALLLAASELPLHHTAGGGFYIAISLAGIGGIFESARWAGPIETARLLALAGVAVVLGALGTLPPWLAAAGVVFCLGSLAWLHPYRHHLTETELAPIM